jgi:hypothetical protein
MRGLRALLGMAALAFGATLLLLQAVPAQRAAPLVWLLYRMDRQRHRREDYRGRSRSGAAQEGRGQPQHRNHLATRRVLKLLHINGIVWAVRPRVQLLPGGL